MKKLPGAQKVEEVKYLKYTPGVILVCNYHNAEAMFITENRRPICR